MTNIAENINNLMELEGISASELSRKTGVDRSVLHKILNGSTKNPSIESIKSIINYYSFDEVVLGKSPIKMDINYVPIISWAEAANFIPANSNNKNYKYIEINSSIKTASFALLVEFTIDSRFPSGTLLIVDQKKEAKNFSYIIIKEGKDNVTSLKRFIYDGATPYLKSIDPSLPSVKFDSSIYTIIGVVVQSIFDFD